MYKVPIKVIKDCKNKITKLVELLDLCNGDDKASTSEKKLVKDSLALAKLLEEEYYV